MEPSTNPETEIIPGYKLAVREPNGALTTPIMKWLFDGGAGVNPVAPIHWAPGAWVEDSRKLSIYEHRIYTFSNLEVAVLFLKQRNEASTALRENILLFKSEAQGRIEKQPLYLTSWPRVEPVGYKLNSDRARIIGAPLPLPYDIAYALFNGGYNVIRNHPA